MKHLGGFPLFNDYSGSPKVLKMVLEGLLKKGYQVYLVSSKGGVLDELLHYKNLHKHSYPYKFSNNTLLTMLRYCLVQVYTFFLAFRWLFRKNIVFYINTLLPVGPALAGRIMGKRVVYHYHENAFVKGAFYKTLATLMQKLAHEIICVSKYQASFLKRTKDVVVVPNALPKEFTDKLIYAPDTAFDRKTVLMLSSLKDYKGTREFIQLSQRLPEYKFVLVINDTQDNIDKYLLTNDLTNIKGGGNLTIYARQENVAPFYNSTSLVINLTNPQFAVETFGLTPLEAMSAGVPVIVPTVGGIAEMVEDDVNGYKIDVQNLHTIEGKIRQMFEEKNLYSRLSNNAMLYSIRYNPHDTLDKIIYILSNNG